MVEVREQEIARMRYLLMLGLQFKLLLLFYCWMGNISKADRSWQCVAFYITLSPPLRTSTSPN